MYDGPGAWTAPAPPEEISLGRRHRPLLLVVAALVVLAAVGLVAWRATASGRTHHHPAAAPALPPAEGDVAEAVDAARPTVLRAAPREAVIGSNNIKIKLDESGPVREVTVGGVRQGPPPGQQLFAFRLEFDGGENNFVQLPGLDLGVSVAGAAARGLALDPGTDESGQLFVVAVPARTTPAELVLTDSGVTQRLDLRTGRPGTRNIAFLRSGQRFVYGTGHGTTTAAILSGGGQPARLRVALSDAQFYFFAPPTYVHPRSPADVFLALNLCYRSPDFVDRVTCHTFRSTDVTVTPAGGRPVTGRILPGTGGGIFFEVPAGSMRGTITIAGSESGSGFRMVILKKLVIPFHFRVADS